MSLKIVSIICTVLNEESSIIPLLEALVNQTHPANEIIIVDGGSSDSTLNILHDFSNAHKKNTINIFSQQGNRSVGRNEAIARSSTSLIAVTDAGCVPKKNWLEELIKKHHESKAQVVAGYYQGKAKNSFEQAVIPYVLVMPDQVDPDSFLPATRSMLIEKKVWQELGGFDEKLSHNEDYAFAKKIEAAGYTMAFAKNAVVEWQPRSSLNDFFVMIRRFAHGDIEAGIVRPKVVLIFLRYVFALLLLLFLIVNRLYISAAVLTLSGLLLYSFWAILKNIRYVKQGWYWLPVLQFTADFGVLTGSLTGLNKKHK